MHTTKEGTTEEGVYPASPHLHVLEQILKLMKDAICTSPERSHLTFVARKNFLNIKYLTISHLFR